MIRAIKRVWYMFEYLTPTTMIERGKFKVRYQDGEYSHNMDYTTAKQYAKMFDGKVVDNF